ncbi:asparagine synthase-related protein [Butyrivibrio sp. MC2013]|uniref:asparagine synthase-related protein n=1 Tax=Butyrivibrio sp. MC2013 TaxID=1280686 RepID=UPI0004253C0C|nr:asparagine synthase-related protein [Butyrivibrio sp. MC2013]
MSGIFGIINKNAKDTYSNALYAKSWNLAYGKEGYSKWSDDECALFCCLEHFTSAPIPGDAVIESGNIKAVVDVVLYNRSEIADKCGIDPSAISDEELLVKYILKFGYSALSKANGDFSGAIYDTKKKTLTLFRDHMGVRPLFYYSDKDFTAFSTDIRGLLSVPGVDRTISDKWIYGLMAAKNILSATATEFEHIYCVRPASYITFSSNEANAPIESIYWKPGQVKVRRKNRQEYTKGLRDIISDAVNIRLNAVPGLIGAELSGGIDSGVIDLLISRQKRECLYFSWTPDTSILPMAKRDERLIIEDICKQEKITCNYINQTQGLKSNMLENLEKIGAPRNPRDMNVITYCLPPYMNTHQLMYTSEFISHNGARVVFSGHAGDEGVSHRSDPYEMFYNHEYYHYLRYMFSTTHGQKHRVLSTLKKIYENLFVTARLMKAPCEGIDADPEVLSSSLRSKYTGEDYPIFTFLYDSAKYIEGGGSRDRLDNTALWGAYCNVRYIFPYTDHRAIDYALGIPRYLFLKGRLNRYVFRDAFRDMMPVSLFRVKDKTAPSRNSAKPDPDYAAKFQESKEYVYSHLDKDFWSKYLDMEEVERWCKEPVSDNDRSFSYRQNHLITLLCLQNILEVTRPGVLNPPDKG